LTVFERALVTRPVRQWAAAIRRFAVVSDLSFTFGTTQRTRGGVKTGLKVAVRVFAPSIVTVHGPAPLHAPLQPENVDPPAAVAVSVTLVPASKAAVHVAPQLIAAGLLVTVPLPVPDFAIVSVNLATGGGGVVGAGAAVTASISSGAALKSSLPGWSYFTVHVPVPVVIVKVGPAFEQAPELE
jgi:hypothetical protein